MAYAVHPASGLVVAVVANAIGLTLLLRERRTEPPVRKVGGTGLGFRVPVGVIATAFIAIGLGSMFGALDISTVAFAKAQGHGGVGGIVLGIISGGSFVGGLVYGARKWRAPLWKRLLVGALLLAAGFSILSAMPTLLTYAAVGFVVGMVIAPSITAQDSVAQRLVPQDQLLEGMSWLRIGLGAGVALGGWLSGRLIDHDGYRAGLHVMAFSAVAVAVFALAGIWWIRRDTLAAEAAGRLDVPPPPGGAHGEQPPMMPVL
jgi:predicted MFS family arabinose efflux permease